MELNVLKSQLESKINELGYELVSFSLSNNKEKILSIVVDRISPIDMDAIVNLSHELNICLDALNPFGNPYTLDISSLGVEKPLKIDRLNDYKNRFVHIHLINPIEGENIYEGELVDVLNESIRLSFHIKTRVKIVDIPKVNISKIRLAIKF